MTESLSGEVEIDPRHAALLIVDAQNYAARRDRCEYLVAIATNACATHSHEPHDWALRNNRGFARQRMTATSSPRA